MSNIPQFVLSDALSDLDHFLAIAPATMAQPQITGPADCVLRRFRLPTDEYISCILWKGLHHITGTDIVRIIAYRFLALGRPLHNAKKFEEGVYSDLRNLKPGKDSSLEPAKVRRCEENGSVQVR